MERHVICHLDELPELTSRRFDVGDVEIVVARSGTRVFALEDRCSHDAGRFDDARVRASATSFEIECPRHGGRFDLADGRATRMPAVAPIEAFAAGVEDDLVWGGLPEL